MTKTYILDTNVLLTDSNSLFGFEEHNLVLPLIVLEELDRHKDRQDEVGRNAREVVRKLADLTKINKDFKAGVPLGGKLGTLRILSIEDLDIEGQRHRLPPELEERKSGDNTIAQFCINYALVHTDETVVLVTRDTILRLKAQAIGVTCEDYRKFNVAANASSLYSGVTTIEREDVVVQDFYSEAPFYLPEDIQNDLFPNQFVVIKSGQQSAVGKFVGKGEPLKKIQKTPSKLTPRNKEQEFAKDLLFDPDIKLITLSGKAGTGKTLCVIDAGIEQILSTKRYRSLVICRPVMPVGKDIGFLPGTLSEKLDPWLAPIKDNLRFLLDAQTNIPATSAPTGSRRARAPVEEKTGKSKFDEQILQSYFDEGIIEVQALTFIRGRSIANAFIIIDEAQNTSLHEIKTILTRVGENTKIVLTGDVEQIDSTYVDSVSNGLSVVIERFKNQKIAGHVTFTKGERSLLATLASDVLG
jgi:PhoH-like ATPase